MKGKKVLSFDLKNDETPREEIAALMLGPTGNLRAPTIVRGKTLLVGFNGDEFEKILG